MQTKKRKVALGESKAHRGVDKKKKYYFRPTVIHDCVSTRNGSMASSNLVVGDIIDSSNIVEENFDCAGKRDANNIDGEFKKRRNDDTQQNDSLSDSESETGKLVVDEKYMEDESGNEREEEIQNIFEVHSNGSSNDNANVYESLSVSPFDSISSNRKDCRLSSNEVVNDSKSSTSSSSDDANDNIINVTKERYVLSSKSIPPCTKQKRIGTNPKMKYQSLLNENIQLKKQIEEYQKHWIPKPEGDAASYFIQLGKSLSNNTDRKQKEKKKRAQKKLNRIYRALNLTKSQLKAAHHSTDITKTCRSITKLLYPDVSTRATMLTSLLPNETITAIREYAKLVHHQPDASTYKLTNAIGNVFAAAKHEQENSKSSKS
ncbi:unnamed protein product [Rotaria magnacalcarata]|uniref:Uncharacterized protein n=3 Tax=Rotaria magnacalcarata TaxID=392030 RepID=A0A815YCM6_9BILA|nr:unnamed protein product [Rotaria magnacalcarata]